MAHSHALRRILPKVSPYLIIRKKIATKMLEFLGQFHRGLRGEYSHDLERLYNEIQELNQKGKKGAPRIEQ
ncbi:MAG: hypothetical protein ACE5KH_05485 [Candidatus Geothermarchaeales archaeon]